MLQRVSVTCVTMGKAMGVAMDVALGVATSVAQGVRMGVKMYAECRFGFLDRCHDRCFNG